MNKDLLFFLLLSFFIILILISLGILSQRNNSPIKSANSSLDYKPGNFTIQGIEQASVNIPFNLKFIANTNKQTSNAVALEVTFDSDVLEVINVDTSQSFCQFYPENRFNNVQGTISIQCGAPHPGFKGENIIANIKFMPKSIAQTQVMITDKSLILISDGKGSNIFSKPVQHNITVLNNI